MKKSLLVWLALSAAAYCDSWVPAGQGVYQVSQTAQSQVWGISTDSGRFLRYHQGQWTILKGKLKQMDAAADGSLWGIGTTGDVFRFDGERWVESRGNLMQLSAINSNDAWGVDDSGGIWHWEGERWRQMPGKFRSVEASSDGQVWAIDFEQRVYAWNQSDWEAVPGHFIQLSAEPNNIWALTESGEVFHLQQQNGQGQWVQSQGNNFRYIHAGADGSVWATDADNNAFYYKR